MVDPEASNELLKEAKALTGEVYKDIAKPVLQEVGVVAGRTAKALLSPIRGMLWGWEQIEKFVEESVQKKLEGVPEERRKFPEPEIAVPLLQALTYTAQNETLREMYINLLANSMDTEKGKVVHPSFVEIIKQMNTLDAKVFEKLSDVGGYQKIVNPSIRLENNTQLLSNGTPDWYIGWNVEGFSEFDVSASLVRISKFGLIELMRDRTAGTANYEEFSNSEYLDQRLKKMQLLHPEMNLHIDIIKSVVYVNEYGNQFKTACK